MHGGQFDAAKVRKDIEKFLAGMAAGSVDVPDTMRTIMLDTSEKTADRVAAGKVFTSFLRSQGAALEVTVNGAAQVEINQARPADLLYESMASYRSRILGPSSSTSTVVATVGDPDVVDAVIVED